MGKVHKPLELKPLAIELELAYRIKTIHADLLSGPIARPSDLKLTGSMFCLCMFPSICSMDVDQEVDVQRAPRSPQERPRAPQQRPSDQTHALHARKLALARAGARF
jgi:hypothetical protein